jgi:short-subunit dehydrogenase
MQYALITGASKGIGKAIAEELASRNHHVLLVARSGSLLKEVADELAEKYKIKQIV